MHIELYGILQPRGVLDDLTEVYIDLRAYEAKKVDKSAVESSPPRNEQCPGVQQTPVFDKPLLQEKDPLFSQHQGNHTR